MSDYTQTTSFTPKDALPSGDPSKKILGAEFDTEFSAISTAIATKYDSNDLATEAQAQLGSSSTVLMTPQRATDHWEARVHSRLSYVNAAALVVSDTGIDVIVENSVVFPLEPDTRYFFEGVAHIETDNTSSGFNNGLVLRSFLTPAAKNAAAGSHSMSAQLYSGGELLLHVADYDLSSNGDLVFPQNAKDASNLTAVLHYKGSFLTAAGGGSWYWYPAIGLNTDNGVDDLTVYGVSATWARLTVDGL